jgi:Skp family chaperone for outer membrane proteins
VLLAGKASGVIAAQQPIILRTGNPSGTFFVGDLPFSCPIRLRNVEIALYVRESVRQNTARSEMDPGGKRIGCRHFAARVFEFSGRRMGLRANISHCSCKECMIVNIRAISKSLLALALTLGLIAPAVAQQAAGHQIAIVDMGTIFQNCVRYKNAIETMKTQTTQLETGFKNDYETMKKMAEEMKALQPGSPDFRKRETEIGKLEIDFKFRQAQARKDFEERINSVQFSLYREIDAVVKQIAVANNIALVFRHNTTAPNGNDPQQVLRAINQSVVYYNPGLDITNLVLSKLNENSAPIAPAATTPGAPNTATRPGVGPVPGAPGKF